MEQKNGQTEQGTAMPDRSDLERKRQMHNALCVNYNRFEYIDTKINKNNNICCDFATFRRAILQGLALAPVGN